MDLCPELIINKTDKSEEKVSICFPKERAGNKFYFFCLSLFKLNSYKILSKISRTF